MKLFKCLFGVLVLLACAVTAQSHRKQPLSSQQPQQLKGPPSEIPFEKCQVEDDDKIQCGTPEISAEQCEYINCCFNEQQCYYGNAVTLQCTRDGQFVVVLARRATLPNVDVNSVTLLETDDPSCRPAGETAAFVIFQFPVTACGTTVKEDDRYVEYQNHMSSSFEVGVGPGGSITRDSHFELLFQCRYSSAGVQALVLEVDDVPPPKPAAHAGPLRVELRLGSGRCYSKGCVTEEAAYGSFYAPGDYPLTKVLREPVYVEVRLLERTDPNIVLTLEHCWATASPDPLSQPHWDLLFDGCPYDEDRFLTTVVPVDDASGLLYPSHYKRFIIRMFAFVDPNTFIPQRDTVFIHCATAVCYPTSTSSCERPCRRERRAAAVAAATEVSSNRRAVVSSQEVVVQEPSVSSNT
ncbi:zona pellucida sperm-binding protein 4-like [Betta splendens]|uniref:Zona pellucida sperm-binding protein 4 n=1 Tax=Betta splendens TaxID=158456 RepID=A0A6P7L4R2_BETSP|nr:zona pellucida sperm-binding protein 4-like [Betta splendens]